jgi:coenzyme F420-0:L-glutamate ligase / coenzyme F420-1:gamma-L-glutamate ligase
MSEALHEFLRTRRSIRRFRPDPVSATFLQKIIETATYSPSAHNDQPWRFVIVETADAKTKITRAISEKFREDLSSKGIDESVIAQKVNRTARRIDEAGAIVLLCRDTTRMNTQQDIVIETIETTLAIQSVAAAGLQLLLAAHAEGMGGTWICWPLYAPAEICSTLDLPSGWRPEGLFFLGYPDEKPLTPPRKPIEETVLHR